MSVKFYEVGHKYESIDAENPITWISVTKLIDNFKEPRMITDNISNVDGENNIISNPNECEGHNLIYNIEDAFKTDCNTTPSTRS